MEIPPLVGTSFPKLEPTMDLPYFAFLLPTTGWIHTCLFHLEVQFHLSVHIYIHIYYTHTHICIYIICVYLYIYIIILHITKVTRVISQLLGLRRVASRWSPLARCRWSPAAALAAPSTSRTPWPWAKPMQRWRRASFIGKRWGLYGDFMAISMVGWWFFHGNIEHQWDKII